MRKLAWILGLTLFAVLPAMAQKDKRAQNILDAMSSRYKSLNSYQAAFTYTSGGVGAKESYKGDLTVKGQKFRLAVGGQEVFTDGKTTSTYLEESNEVNIQNYDASSNDELNPTQIYNIYKRGFNYRFLKEQKQGGRTLEVVELTPTQAKNSISKVQISVDKADKSIRNWLITNKDGKKTSYTITKFTPNVTIPDSYFVFDNSKHPGVEVVDLR
jgi:outer membrane lipoprotein-sorting protein